MGVRTNDEDATAPAEPGGSGADEARDTGTAAAGEVRGTDGAAADDGDRAADGHADESGAGFEGPDVVHEPDGEVSAKGVVSSPGPDGEPVRTTRRFPSVTTDTARPEGGGRAAPGDAPAPARQWPLLTVLALAGLGLLIVGTDAFADAFRVGTILIGVALITGAVMRRVLPSVGMLAVRSRFTDMVTYGLLGVVITLLALVTQPRPWLDLPFLEDAVHFTVR
ncbi:MULTISPECIES: DUF3017 domain-containing protein [unclassified Streptomyces]|uniref:DUF3017 domain-containing protein n=1 Tax=unclassified Streptomyces TaxID=2593676 RepID=UPI00331F4B1D